MTFAGWERGVAHFRMADVLSGVPVGQTMWLAIKLREGKLKWWAIFRTEGEVLEAVGLPGVGTRGRS